ncbi:MAG: sigma 54-interacting transcriptional regulator [Planctomycetota bacterium]
MTRILIVESEAGPRAELAQTLADRGDEVVHAATAAEAVDSVFGTRPAAVLCALDLDGPAAGAGRTAGSGAVELCRKLRESFTRERLAFVLFSRRPVPPERTSEALTAGADAIVGPDQVDALDAVVDAALRTRSALRVAAETVSRLRDDKQRLEKEMRDRVGAIVNEFASSPELVANELVASRPDGVLVVGTSGQILYADVGAHELLGGRLVGRSVGSVVPRSRLASFVSRAGPDDHDRFSFDDDSRRDRASRRLLATVTAVLDESRDLPARVVLLLDLARRGPVERVAGIQSARVPDRHYRRLLAAARAHLSIDAIPRRSEPSARLVHGLVAAARHLHPVLLRGPEGSGRRHFAEVLHHARYATGPFLELACDGLNESSQEIELYGDREADGERARGLVARAKDGTLVLQEVECLALPLQSRIVDVAKDPNLRVVGTTRATAETLVASGQLLPELAGVFAGSVLDVPPLRERRPDLPEMIAAHMGRDAFARVTRSALEALVAWDWPGGVPEMEREVDRLKALDAPRIEAGDLDPEIVEHARKHAAPELLREVEIPAYGPAVAGRAAGESEEAESVARVREPAAALVGASGEASSGGGEGGHGSSSSSGEGLRSASPSTSSSSAGRGGAWVPEESDWMITENDPLDLEVYERKALLRALAVAKGNRTQAARLVGIGKSTFYRKLQKWRLSGGGTSEDPPRST